MAMENLDNITSQNTRKEINPEDKVLNNLDILLAKYSKESVFETDEKRRKITSVDESIKSIGTEYEKTLKRVLERYGCDVDIEKIGNGLFRVQMPHDYVVKKIPEGYGYIGGAARSVLNRIFNIDEMSTPRDVDIVRIINKDIFGMDVKMATEYSAEDYLHGHGVQELDQDYFKNRDFTINECLVYGDWVYMTKECLLDTVRRILRFTQYEKRYSDESQMRVDGKLLSKAVRLVSEEIAQGRKMEIVDKEAYEFANIKPFFIALHLDRAFSRGDDVAAQYISELVSLGQLPDWIKDPNDAIDYLLESMQRPYVFQFAPKEVFKIDYEIDEMYRKFGHIIEKYEN